MERPIIYTKNDDRLLKLYKCALKAKYANNRHSDNKLTQNDVLLTIKRFNLKCGYCSDPLRTKNWQLDHFYSKSMGGKNIHQNLVPTCKWCNVMKNALCGHSFILKCEKIIKFNQINSITR